MTDIYLGFWQIFNFFNPFWWLGRIFADVEREEAELDAYYDSLDDEELQKL